MKLEPEQGHERGRQRQSPPPLDNVYEDFQAVEQNLRRYVDYRLDDLAPPDRSWYQRWRVEIWGMAILVALLLPTALEFVPLGSTSTPPAQAEDVRQADPAKPPPPAQTPADAQDQETPAAAPASEGTTDESLRSRYAEIQENPSTWWQTYVAQNPQQIADLMQELAQLEGLGGQEDLVSPRQKSNFVTWSEEIRQGSGADRVGIGRGLFEYVLIRWQVENEKPFGGGRPKVDLVIGTDEYLEPVIRHYFDAMGWPADVPEISDGAAKKASVQVATIVAWLETEN